MQDSYYSFYLREKMREKYQRSQLSKVSQLMCGRIKGAQCPSFPLKEATSCEKTL